MDILIPALILVVLSIVGLTALKVPPKKPEPVPAPVKCPKCATGSHLKDIACPNCGNKKLKISRANPASPVAECPECKINAGKLACPKCSTDLIKLLIEKAP